MRGTEESDGDILYGLKRIAQHLGLTPRQVEHMIVRGSIPTFKMGKVICTTRSALREHFERLLAASVAGRGCTGIIRKD